MAKGLVTDTYLTNIADAIRAKSGSTISYKPGEMADAINSLKLKPDFISFAQAPGTSLDISWLDTSNMTSMSGMFDGAWNLLSIDLSNFDTSKVTDMSYMFRDCNHLPSIDLSSFDTSNVQYFNYMFGNCQSLSSIDVSNFDTHTATSMWGMFSDLSSLTSIDVSNFDTSRVVTMQYMFGYCSSLTHLDLTNFDTSNLEEMSWMFQGCRKLATLDISSFDISNVTGRSGIFTDCGSELSTPTIVYVKDTATQQWVLNSEYTGAPSNWSTDNVIIKNNLLNLLEDNAEYVTFEGSGATVTFNNDNTLTVSADGTAGWGVNIAQPNLTLEAGKTYTLSCNDMLGSTWISLNNENDMMISRDVASKSFTPESNIVNPTVVIWVSGGVVYDNVKWNIKLIENI